VIFQSRPKLDGLRSWLAATQDLCVAAQKFLAESDLVRLAALRRALENFDTLSGLAREVIEGLDRAALPPTARGRRRKTSWLRNDLNELRDRVTVAREVIQQITEAQWSGQGAVKLSRAVELVEKALDALYRGPFLTAAEVALLLGFSDRYVGLLVSNGTLHPRSTGDKTPHGRQRLAFDRKAFLAPRVQKPDDSIREISCTTRDEH
jgi:hypothetical protein